MKISAVRQELLRVISKQLPGICQGVHVIPPWACTDGQEELLPAVQEKQGLWKKTDFAATAGYPQRTPRVDLLWLCFGLKSYALQTIINCHAKKNEIINYTKQKPRGCLNMMQFV